MNLAEGILLQREEELRPCVVVSSSNEEDQATHQQHKRRCKCLTSLSYRDAARALQEHRKWLNDREKDLIQPLLAAGGACDHHDPSKRIVVLAFLAHNSEDLFLSVLASTTTTSNGETAASPALINTRWTVREIAQALQQDDDHNGSVQCYCTLLIYDKEGGLEETARQVADTLLSTPQQNRRQRHVVQCVPLPTFARDTMVPVSEIPSTQLDDSSFPPPVEIPDYRAVSSDDAVIVFTSGTTGGSKGVRLGHRAIYVQCLAKLQKPCCYNESTRLLANTVPFFHVGGLSSIMAVWLAGGTLVLPSRSSNLPLAFDPRTTLDSLRQRHSTTLVVVPAMLYALQQEQQKMNRSMDVVEADLRCYPEVQLILIGGQSADASTLQFVRHTFPNARIVQTYACTEAASSLTFRDVTKPLASDGATHISGECVGRPPLHVELRLFRVKGEGTAQNESSTNGFISERWTPGIIGTRGPHVMNGYWRRSRDGASTKQTPSHSSWLRTNDLGFWGKDGQTLYFCGRVTDSIRTGGETVLAAEVERCLLQHPNLVECAVFPLPDRKFGETVACAVVVGDPLQVDDIKETICALCARKGLAGYKRPRLVFQVDKLPRNSSGKILKFKLVKRFGARQRCHL